ncbi:MAG TPA: hypothetical protein VIJ14_02050, partial [Rhabdochlamydiaceae bacterium]
MTSTLNSIPNSSGVSTVLNLFSFCFTYLKNARPLSGSSHAVTSLITPQDSSRTSPLLIAAGAVASLVAIYIVTRVIFRKPPPSTPPGGDLSGRADVVTPPPVSGSVSASGGAGPKSSSPSTVVEAGGSSRLPSLVVERMEEGLLPLPPAVDRHVVADAGLPLPVAGQERPKSAPLPLAVPVHPHEGVNAGTPPPPVIDQERPESAPLPSGVPVHQIVKADAGLPPPPPIDDQDRPASASTPAIKPPSPLPTSNSSSALLLEEDVRLAREPVGQRSPQLLVLEPAAQPSRLSPRPPVSSDRPSPSSSPESRADESDSSSDGETESRSPSPPQASAVGRLVGAVTYFISTGRHFTKWTKYRLIQEQLELFSRSKDVDFRRPENGESNVDNTITTAWNNLIRALLQPTSFETPDEQYRATVACLRKTRQLLISSDASTQQKFASQLQFVRELSYERFAGIELFPYCQQLIEHASEEPLPSNLTLANFKEELKLRTTVLKHPAEATAMNPVACQANKARGTLNIDFDPLLKTSNIPYRDGLITANNRSTLILWHGTPVEQNDPYGLMFDLAAGALSYIPYVRNWIGDSNPVSRPPVVNADYVAFIEEA